jgi:hypothetical protein
MCPDSLRDSCSTPETEKEVDPTPTPFVPLVLRLSPRRYLEHKNRNHVAATPWSFAFAGGRAGKLGKASTSARKVRITW